MRRRGRDQETEGDNDDDDDDDDDGDVDDRFVMTGPVRVVLTETLPCVPTTLPWTSPVSRPAQEADPGG